MIMDFKDSHIEQLIISSLCGSITTQEEAELTEWLNLNQKNKATFELYQKSWNVAEGGRIGCQIDVECDWQKVKNKIFDRHGERTTLRFLRLAAILTSTLLVGVIGYLLLSPLATSNMTIVASNDIKTFYLPDSSFVILNKGGQLSYNSDFDSSNREVALTGEAFFSVEKMNASAFDVMVSGGRVKVMGTKFAVSSHASTTEFEVRVESGKVLVSNGDKAVILANGEMASASQEKIIKQESYSGDDLDWKYSKIVFKSASLETIAKELVVFYPEIDSYQIESGDNTIQLTTSFENQKLSDVLQEVSTHFGKKIAVQNRILVISN